LLFFGGLALGALLLSLPILALGISRISWHFEGSAAAGRVLAQHPAMLAAVEVSEDELMIFMKRDAGDSDARSMWCSTLQPLGIDDAIASVLSEIRSGMWPQPQDCSDPYDTPRFVSWH